ncbi:hypothetical protein [Bradyrhizobium diazoefficiens]|uniref:Uncharacterized protein n=1 Tax=Bradyrhizobium diazoefficiens TaxID=1355477 RepID=A0A809X4W3_9BRAD|nr:hypothetical protein XF1B_50570 [Bradyrhizobium diazoefficiens]BCE48640.1 hypothetical protein XF4B_49890 [Bradyrhizobium diazoefficiens]BCE92155.1 hypothetical protein XF10B_49530 [Bradyrhizobium diazoefficiens]BCF27082.1 hypothetical protein XF14B_50340 [Bradyrhizobium diazoefficiens]
MACLPESVSKAMKDAGDEETGKSIEESYQGVLAKRADFIEYGDPEKLTDKQRAKLNCALLKQVLIHRAERLMVACGQMFETKNLYALALSARGHMEAVAVMGYMTRRLDSLIKGNIEFARFEEDIANGLMGAHDDIFTLAKAPVNVLTCVEHTDKILDAEFFKEKKQAMQSLYTWLSEFAHPNFCSNKSAFDLDKATGRMVLRKENEINTDYFQTMSTLCMSGSFLQWLIELFDTHVETYFKDEEPKAA